MEKIHPYRTHTCSALRLEHYHQQVRLSGWVHRKRDHGNVVFIDLRDHYGIVQCVIETGSSYLPLVESLKLESVVTITGKVNKRSDETTNTKLPTGEIEVLIQEIVLLSAADPLPLQVNSDVDYSEEMRLRYRFLDLRRDKVHRNITLRSQVIASLRRRMIEQDFTEFQTPILTSSSPEGARDYLVPSRIHPGCFYALPQAPQQFKQLLMIAGFDRYFQIAPCFRDEDGRADRSPGEFYQLDFEMSFVTQEDVFAAIEPVLYGVFQEFSAGRTVTPYPFVRIPYKEALLKYGTDKPDLRNPLLITEITSVFTNTDFTVFAEIIKKGGTIRAIKANVSGQPRRFFDTLNNWAQTQGMPGVGYITFSAEGIKGPIAKFLSEDDLHQLKNLTHAEEGDAVFFIAGPMKTVEKFSGAFRKKLGEELDLIERNIFKFCWITDFPMYEMEEETGKIIFSHNPFSMPQGGLEALLTQDPLTINAYQYDIVCNGYELSSGAIRNHLPEVMIKAFEIAGYGPEVVEQQFGGLFNALKFGAPPHGGSAPGVDRIVMLLAEEPNIREVIAFPMNQQAQDLLMQAPSPVALERLKELHLRLIPSAKDNRNPEEKTLPVER